MKLNKCLQLLAAIVFVILLPTSDAGKKKIQFKKIYSSGLAVNSAPQPTISRPPSPTRFNPGSSGITEARSVAPKESFRLPGPSGTQNSVDHRKHDDFPALGGNLAGKVDQYTRLSPHLQRKSPPPAQTESILSKNPFARLPGAQKSSDHASQPKSEEFPPLGGSSERLSANGNPAMRGSSTNAAAFNKKSLRSPEAQRKLSLHDYPALSGSGDSKNPSSRPSLESLTNSQSKLSLDQFPALRGSSSRLNIPKHPLAGNPSPSFEKKISLEEYPALGASRSLLKSGQNPVERSSSLTLNSQSASHQAALHRGSSVESTKDWRFPSQFNSPLNSPLEKNKSFFGSSSSSLASTSGLGTSYHSTSSGSFSSLSAGLNSPGLGRGRKLSDVSLVPKKPIAVSDKTCKDDSSPAEQCFNYFTFSLFWPPALGYEYKSSNKPVNDNVNIARWSVHGLWPASYSGVIPENCYKRTSVTFNQHRFEREKGLRANLESKWINICPYKQRGCSLVSFWDREFKTHGACATRSPLIGSDVGYFKMAVSLANSVNLDHLLSKIGLNPGKIMTYGDIVEKISENLGTKARVEIVQNKKTNEYYLKEIRVCYDLNLHRINCPGKKLLLQEIRDLNIRHLDYVPAV